MRYITAFLKIYDEVYLPSFIWIGHLRNSTSYFMDFNCNNAKQPWRLNYPVFQTTFCKNSNN